MTTTGSHETIRSNLIGAKKRANLPRATGLDEDLRTPVAGEGGGRPDGAESLFEGQWTCLRPEYMGNGQEGWIIQTAPPRTHFHQQQIDWG